MGNIILMPSDTCQLVPAELTFQNISFQQIGNFIPAGTKLVIMIKLLTNLQFGAKTSMFLYVHINQTDSTLICETKQAKLAT